MMAGLIALLAVGTVAAASDVQLEHHLGRAGDLKSPANEAMAFWDRFQSEFHEQAAEKFADRFHPFSSLSWRLRMEEDDTSHFHDRTTRGARKALYGSFTHGLREASVDLPLMTWLKERQGVLADFLRNSIGNVREEAVSPQQLSYRAVERSWWGRLAENSGLRYGVRPFRTAPYAYASIGIRDGENLLLLANVRYVFRDFNEHKFEVALSVPLAHGVALDVGASHKMDRHDEGQQVVLKLFKQRDNGSLFYVGAELLHQPAVYAGLCFAL
ncbi:MAG: hypothetical protein KJ070_09870 [Verrucomicrobia bacterium]|nr:hypothetical protein [Verrucomicrobiota bacterium]